MTTNNSEIRDLTFDEIDIVSGGALDIGMPDIVKTVATFVGVAQEACHLIGNGFKTAVSLGSGSSSPGPHRL